MAIGFGKIRPFFRGRMKALGFTEWTDAFNTANIPATFLEKKAFHVGMPSGARQDQYDMTSQDLIQDVVIRCFFPGHRQATENGKCLDDAYEALDRIIDDIQMKRGQVPQIKNIFTNNWRVDQLDQSNDTVAVLEITFSCLMISCA